MHKHSSTEKKTTYNIYTLTYFTGVKLWLNTRKWTNCLQHFIKSIKYNHLSFYYIIYYVVVLIEHLKAFRWWLKLYGGSMNYSTDHKPWKQTRDILILKTKLSSLQCNCLFTWGGQNTCWYSVILSKASSRNKFVINTAELSKNGSSCVNGICLRLFPW